MRLLHQVNKKWHNLSYQFKFCGWSDTNTWNTHKNAFISKNLYSRLWKTLFQLFAFTIAWFLLLPDLNGSIHNTNLQNSVIYSERVITVCSCHVTYPCQIESILYSCLNVKELLAQSRRQIWSLSDCNWTKTHNHLVRKRTLNDLTPTK